MADTYPHSPDDRPAVGDRLPGSGVPREMQVDFLLDVLDLFAADLEDMRVNGHALGKQMVSRARAVARRARAVLAASPAPVVPDDLGPSADRWARVNADAAPVVPDSPDLVERIEEAVCDAGDWFRPATLNAKEISDAVWAVVHPTATAPQAPGVTRETVDRSIYGALRESTVLGIGYNVSAWQTLGAQVSDAVWTVLGVPVVDAPAAPEEEGWGVAEHFPEERYRVVRTDGGWDLLSRFDRPAAPEEGRA